MTDQIDKLKRLNGELCAEINEKDRRIRELETENDELLEAWSNQAKTIYEQIKRIRNLESLVRDMYSMRECFRPNNRWPWIEKRIRELGIEVDG